MSGKSPLGLLASVPFEAGHIRKHLRNVRLEKHVARGTLKERPVALLVSGMGAANAAWGATVLIERAEPCALVVLGIGGAYPGSGLAVGEVAACEREVYADLGVLTPGGLAGLEATGIPLLRRGRKTYFQEFPLDRGLLRKALRHLHIRSGTFLTVAQVTGTLRRARELRRRFGALCENMEGAAAAQVCARYGVPLLEVRGISNMVSDREPASWRKREAARNCQHAVMELIGVL
ncbi:MAG: futalosine hydrolase [Nitrospirota bacterium]|jgi:futalosine hydrolase